MITLSGFDRFLSLTEYQDFNSARSDINKERQRHFGLASKSHKEYEIYYEV